MLFSVDYWATAAQNYIQYQLLLYSLRHHMLKKT